MLFSFWVWYFTRDYRQNRKLKWKYLSQQPFFQRAAKVFQNTQTNVKISALTRNFKFWLSLDKLPQDDVENT